MHWIPLALTGALGFSWFLELHAKAKNIPASTKWAKTLCYSRAEGVTLQHSPKSLVQKLARHINLQRRGLTQVDQPAYWRRQAAGDVQFEKPVAKEIHIAVGGIDCRRTHPSVIRARMTGQERCVPGAHGLVRSRQTSKAGTQDDDCELAGFHWAEMYTHALFAGMTIFCFMILWPWQFNAPPPHAHFDRVVRGQA